MSTAKLITERVAAPLEALPADGIDEANGVIRGVVVCGLESANGRRYPRAVLERDHRVYEGAKVYFDHAKDRKFDDAGGWLSNVKAGPDGRPRADLNVYKSDRRAAKVFEAARRNPTGFGLSHVAYCDTRLEGGVEVVEAIRRVESVDIVTDPATVGGLLESKGGGSVATIGLKKLLERVAATTSVDNILRLRRLSEMDGMADLAVPEPAEAGDPDDAIDTAFASAMHAQVDAFIAGKLDLPGLLAKLKELAKAHGNVSDSGEGKGGGEGEGGKPSEESRKKGEPDGKLILEALAVADKVGLKPDAADLQLLAATPATAREAVAKKLLKASRFDEGTPPSSLGRQGAARLEEGKAAGSQQQTQPLGAW